MANLLDKAREYFSPGNGTLSRMFAERDAVNAAIKAVNERHGALRRHEAELLAVANGPVGADPLARIVAQEKHQALRPQFDALAAELDRLGERQVYLVNHIAPLLEAVAILRSNLRNAVTFGGGVEHSAGARIAAWAEAAAKLNGLLDLTLPRKLPTEDTERVWREYNKAISDALYPANRAA